jgi:hypothetical protein
MTGVIPHMLPWAVLHIFRYTGMTQPVHGGISQTLRIFNKAFSTHFARRSIEAFLHYAAYLPGTANAAFATSLVYQWA